MAEEENKENKRSFVGPDGAAYYVSPPSANDIREADWHYSKTYTRSLTEGITTSAEMMDILRRRGIIGSEFEKRAVELAKNLNQNIFELEKAETIEQKRDRAVLVAEARDELFQWNQRLNGPMAHTCEQMADDARLEHLASCMVTNSEGNRVWAKYDDYLKEKNQALALKSRFEVMLYLQGLDSDFLEKTPEARAMKDIQVEVLARAEEAAKALRAVEQEELEDANKVTSNNVEAVVEVVEEKPKKAKKAKKKSE
jgi:hypothetical protein